MLAQQAYSSKSRDESRGVTGNVPIRSHEERRGRVEPARQELKDWLCRTALARRVESRFSEVRRPLTERLASARHGQPVAP
eukprot:6206994-Pleurochrysis_carterae.AAC.4